MNQQVETAMQVDPHGQHRDPAPVARTGQVRGELARDGGGQRRERQDGARGEVGAPHEQVVTVQRHDHRPESREHGRPCRQPEVRVHDVEALAAVARTQHPRRVGQSPRPRPEGEQLDLHVVATPQRLDLIAHEGPERRTLSGGVHVRHDQRTHGPQRYRRVFFHRDGTDLSRSPRSAVAGPPLKLSRPPRNGPGGDTSEVMRCTS